MEVILLLLTKDRHPVAKQVAKKRKGKANRKKAYYVPTRYAAPKPTSSPSTFVGPNDLI